MKRHEHPTSDEGSALVIALVFVLVTGLIITALLTQTSTNFKTTQVVRSNADKVYAADAGLEQAIELLRLDTTLCTGSGGPPLPAIPPINGHSVRLFCETVAGEVSGAAGWALVVTDPTAGLVTLNPGGKTITGPVFAGGLRSGIDRPLTVLNGSVFESQASGCAGSGSQPGDLTVAPDPPYSYRCTPSTVASVLATIADELPDVVPPTAPAVDTTTYPGCRVFSPGTYTSANPPVFGGSQYLRTGTYYFNDVELDLAGTIIGGKPADGESSGPVTVPPDCEMAIDDDSGEGTGVKLIFGGSARFESDTEMEFFARRGGPFSEGEMGISIHAPAAAENGFAASALGSAGLFEMREGNGPHVVFHGLVYAPGSTFRLVSVHQNAIVAGGLVARSVSLRSPSTDTPGPLINVFTEPGTRQMVVTATAEGQGGSKNITATAVLELDNNEARTFKVVSWRVE